MIEIASIFLGAAQFGHQIKSGKDTAKLLDELSKTAKSIDQNMARLVENYRTSFANPITLTPTLTKSSLLLRCEHAASLAEETAAQGASARKAIEDAQSRFAHQLDHARTLAATVDFSTAKEQTSVDLSDTLKDYKLIDIKASGEISRIRVASEREVVLIHSINLANGWMIVLQEGLDQKNGHAARSSIINLNPYRIIYEQTFAKDQLSGEFCIARLTGAEGVTAHYSKSRRLGEEKNQNAFAETFFFARDFLDDAGEIFGVEQVTGEEVDFQNTYEGQFSVSPRAASNLLGSETFELQIFRNGFGVRSIRVGTTHFEWLKGEFRRGSPTG